MRGAIRQLGALAVLESTASRRTIIRVADASTVRTIRKARRDARAYMTRHGYYIVVLPARPARAVQRTPRRSLWDTLAEHAL